MLPHDDVGSGPAVVLVHAGIADRRMWAAHLEPIAAAGHRVIAVDLAGFGDAPVAERFAPDTDLLGTLAELGIDRAVLVGVSFGGAIAQRAAVADPGRIAGLVLVSAPTPEDREPSPELAAAWEAEEEALEAGDVDAAVAAVLDHWLLPDASRALRELVGEMQRRAIENQLAAPDAEPVPDPFDGRPDVLRELDVPALVACGEHDMPDFREAATEVAAQLRCQAIVIPGARHLAPLETPEAFGALLLGFLEDAELRLAALWDALDTLPPDAFVAQMDELAPALLDPGVAAFERASARDATGATQDAVALYREALEHGLSGSRRRQAVIQLASSLRAVGDAVTAVELLREEQQRPSDELDGAVAGFLALALADTGAPREAAAIAIEALAAQLPRYRRSLTAYAREL